MSAYINNNNNSKNVANLLRLNQTQQSNRIRNRKGDKNLVRIGNPQTIQTESLRPQSQQYAKINQSNLPEQNQNIFKISKKRRETPQSYNDEIQLPQLTNNNVLLSQVQNFQRLLQNQMRRNRKITEELEFTKIKLNDNTRHLQQRQNILQHQLQSRIIDLENQINRQHQNKVEFQQKIGYTEFNQKQIINVIKNIQDQYSNQINNLKALIQEKRTQQQALLMKQKQKSTALFLEVVRLGDNLQKSSQTIQNITNNFEGRVQFLEGKLSNNQKNLMSLAQKNSSGNDIMNQFSDKILTRLQNMESNLLILGKEQLKDKELVNKLDSSTNRIAEDLNSLLKNMANDFQSRMEGRVTEIVNRIVYERQQRVKAQQQIRRNLDLKQRIIAERQLNQKEKLENKYQSMDAQIRSQFLRKDQSLKALQEALQDQYKLLMKAIDKQEKARQNTQNQIDNQLKRIQQNFRKEYDIYKLHQSDLVEKITQMIKIEINTRLNSDVDLKNLTSAIGNDLANDLNNLKEAFSNSTKKLNITLKQLKSQSAERAAQLSHYIDQQIKKVVEVVSQKYNKMKSVFAKLSELFRNHLASTENNRKNFETRIQSNERDFEILKNEVNSVIDEFYKDLETRLKEEKQSIETFTFKKQNENTIRLNKLQQYVNQHFQLIKQGLQGNKQIMNNQLSSFSNQNGKVIDSSSKDFKQLTQVVHKIRDISENLKEQTEEELAQLKNIITQNNTATKQQLINIKTELTNQILTNVKKTSQIEQVMTTTNSKLTNDFNTLKMQVQANRDVNNDNMKKVNQDIEGAYKNITELENIIKKQNEKNQEEIARVKNDLTILQSEVRTSDQALHEDMNKIIEITDLLKQKIP